MEQTLFHPAFQSEIIATDSKSQMLRLLICALLSSCPVQISYRSPLCEDMKAAIACCEALGANIITEKNVCTVYPPKQPNGIAVLPCSDSGAALRFFTALCAALGIKATLVFSDGLARRPIQPLLEALRENGAVFHTEKNSLTLSEGLSSCDFTVPGHISSQFVSALLFACAVKGGSVTLSSPLKSREYVRMTLQALSRFGCAFSENNGVYTVSKAFPLTPSDKCFWTEGDWSNAAYALIGGLIGKKPVSVGGLRLPSVQGDSVLPALLREAGGRITEKNGVFTAFPSPLHGTAINGDDIPDLILPLCVAAVCAEGETVITGVKRLKSKETDRLNAVLTLMTALGGKIQQRDDALILHTSVLSGGSINGQNDHRTVMTAALAACVCQNAVRITDAESVSKSYPGFWETLKNSSH